MQRVPGRTSDTILTVVKERNHALGVHFLANVELVVLEVGDDLLGERGRALLEGLYPVGLALLELAFNRLHVTLEVGEERLFVERGRLETEGVDDVVDLGRALLEGLVRILCRGVGAYAERKVCVQCARGPRVDQGRG